MRHFRNAAQATAGMLSPTRTALELAARCRVTDLDIRLPIPSIFLSDMFPEQPPEPDHAIMLMPGTALNGAPNIFEQFILCALVKKIQPQTILEIGTFKGGTRGIFISIPLQARQVHETFWTCGSPQGSKAQSIRGGINGWAARVCGAVWNRGVVYRTFGRASLARRIRLCRVRRRSGVAAEDAPAGV